MTVDSAALALDVGGTKIAVGLVDRSGQVARREVVPVAPASGGGSEGLWAAVAAAVGDVLQGQSVEHVGVGSAGPLDPTRGTVSPVNIPVWRDFPILDRVLALSGARHAVLAGDTAAMTYCELRHGSAAGLADLIGIVVSTGIGGCLVADGRVLHGSRGNAGFLGHLPLDPQGPVCRCGQRGCPEASASGPSMVRLAREAGWSGPEGATFADVAAAARDGDPHAQRAVGTGMDVLAHALVVACVLVDTYDVVVGGGVSLAGDVVLEPLRKAMTRHASTTALVRVPAVHVASYGSEAGLVGAGLLALEDL